MHSELRRRLHWAIGSATLALFILSGAYMRWVREPAVETASNETRAVYRSRHLFLLLTATANLAYAAGLSKKSRSTTFASIAIMTVPLLFAAAFCTEPEQGVTGRAFSTPALYTLFAAAVAMAIGARPGVKSASGEAEPASK